MAQLILTRTPAEADSGKRTKGNTGANGSGKEDYDTCVYMRAPRLQKRLVTLEVWVKKGMDLVFMF